MATGKSAVGQVLASRLGYEWVDTDSVIESRHGPIFEIFENDGEEAFREMERGLASELAARDGLVISTGGRMMLDPLCAERLGRNASVFCLTARPGEVLRRVRSQVGPPRPLLAGNHPADRIAELMAERAEGYERFEQIETDRMSLDQVADEIMERLEHD
jgi:shikimate kinase